MNNLRILAVDPSGTGTTGIYYRDKWTEKFFQFTSKEWVKHCWFILDLVRDWQPDFLLFETSNYVSLRGKDMTYLWKLLGAIEALPYGFLGLHAVTIPVNQVKALRSKLLKGSQSIEGIEYKKGIGWHYQTKKISTHGLDAYLVYWLWQEKQNKELISQSIGEIKIEPNYQQKDIEEEFPEDIVPEINEEPICGNIDDGPDIDDDLTEEEIEDHD